MNREKIWWLIIIGFVLTIIAALSVIRSPVELKVVRADKTMLSNGTIIVSELRDFYSRNNILPQYLSDIKSTTILELNLPDVKNMYSDTPDHFEYNIISINSFELCMFFRASYENSDDINIGYSYGDNFHHNFRPPFKEGRNCFTYESDEELEAIPFTHK